MHSICVWDSENSDERVTWSHAFGQAIRNELQFEVRENLNIAGTLDEKMEKFYGNNLDRLRLVKKKYDPKNIFKRNHNIVE